MDARITNMITQEVSVIEDKSEFPPTLEELEDSNKTYSLDAAVLFIDIRHSTRLMEESKSETMVKIYRTFMRSMIECVRKNGGVTRQFLGDRIMGIFKESPDEDLSASDKAINAAINMQTTIDYVLNKNFNKYLNNKLISCGIGIDYGNILVTKVGMHGLESDNEKENELDFVWVGNATNHASKYTDLAPERSIFVSKRCYENLKSVDKTSWGKYTRSKGGYTLNGYLLQNVYSSNAQDLGDAFYLDEGVVDEENIIIDSISALEKQYEVLISKEKDIAVKEAEFNKERDELQKKVQALSNKVDELSKTKEKLSRQLNSALINYYDCLTNIIGSWHCSSSQYKEGFRKESVWKFYIDEAYKTGAKLGLGKDNVTKRNDCGLMEIYMYIGEPEKAFDVLLVMAKNCNVWINLREDIVSWANKNDKLSTLIYVIEGRLDRYEIPLDEREEFYGYAQKLRKIRGY